VTPARWALALACTIAFVTRAILPFYNVFQSGFINFQENDAWFHVRIMEHLVRHFPHRLFIDPYGSILDGQRVDTGPFYDWIPAFLALPFPDSLHTIAAWYPAILGIGIIAVVFQLTKALFHEHAAAVAALVAATLPGYFLAVSSLGFTDHHVMESLLSLLVLTLLVQRRPIPAGFALAAYLLTFVGGAFLVAILTAWSAYGFFRYPEDPDFTPNLLPVFAIPLLFTAPFLGLLWMEITLAALAGGLLATGAAMLCRRLSWPRATWLAGLAALTAAGLVFFPQILEALRYLVPNRKGAAGGVAELQSFVFAKGYFSLEWAWLEFGGVYILAIVGVLLLAEAALRRNNNPARTLFALWSLAVFALAMAQVRMVYYFAPAAAILTGYLIHRAWTAVSRKQQPLIALLAIALVFGPNLYRLAAGPFAPPAAVPDDWRDALDYLRTQTPEPYGDPNAYFADGINPGSSKYGVLSWWDYGYWIEAIGRRIPLSNPTQKNASVAAQFFLAQSESEAIQIMEKWRLQYVAMDLRLADSLFPVYFNFLPEQHPGAYFIEAYERLPEGKPELRRFYLPAYYNTMASRLGLRGEASPGNGRIAVVTIKNGLYSQINKFAKLEDARLAQQRCAADGCQLVGENAFEPIAPVPPLTQLKLVFPDHRNRSTVTVFQRN
jgi:dolichyl-diphosphooligosaccharide--protein glycosyltransferase